MYNNGKFLPQKKLFSILKYKERLLLSFVCLVLSLLLFVPSFTLHSSASNALKPQFDAGGTVNPLTPSIDFAPKVDFSTSRPYAVAIGDLDGDGKLDLAVADHTYNNNVSVFRNTSTPGVIDTSSFAPKVVFSAFNGQPNSITIGDLDGDGKLDLAVAADCSDQVSVFRNTGTPGVIDTSSFAPVVPFTGGVNNVSVAIGDLDGDGKLDLVTANTVAHTVSVLRNTSTPGVINTNSFAPKVSFSTGGNTFAVAIGDLDGDGKLDLATANYNSKTVSVLRNTSTPGVINTNSFAPKVDFSGFDSATSVVISVAIGDLDGDGKLDLVLPNMNSSNPVSVLRNTSTPGVIDTNSFAPKVDLFAGVSPSSVAIGDLNGDGKRDLAVTNHGKTVSVLRNTSTPGVIDTSSFAPEVSFSTTATFSHSIAIGDLDRDGCPDLAVANFDNDAKVVSVLRSICQACPTTSFSENFDEVFLPNLPSGWSTQLLVGQSGDAMWVTQSKKFHTSPNAAQAKCATHATDKVLISPVIFVPNTSTPKAVIFKNYFKTNKRDGGVLEISINGQPFQDILAVGGSFQNADIDSSVSTVGYGNVPLSSGPLAGRHVWSGNSNGWWDTKVNLPPSINGQQIQLRWRFVTNSPVTSVSKSMGQFIDTITTEGFECPTITLTSSIANGAVGMAYSQTITAVGATPPVTYTVSSGIIPPGLNLTASGILSGTPTLAGNYTFVIKAIDANCCVGEMKYTVTIKPASPCNLSISSSIGNGDVGNPYSSTITGSGSFTPPLNFIVSSGNLPPGLVLTSASSTSATIAGTPTAGGNFTFTITATDPNGCFSSVSYTVTIKGASCNLTLSPTTINNGNVGNTYSSTITGSGNFTPPLNFTLSSGILPPGLVLTNVPPASATITGTPTVVGTFIFTITATDLNKCSSSSSYTVTIGCPTSLTVTPTTLPPASLNVAYNQTLTASSTASFTLSSGMLPPGLTLQESPPLSATISGTPTTVGTFDFVLLVGDPVCKKRMVAYTIVVQSMELKYLYVADPRNSRCQRFDGTNWTLIGPPGCNAIAANFDESKIAIFYQNSVQVSTDNGNTWSPLTTINTGYGVGGIAIATNGDIYVSDYYQSRILRFLGGTGPEQVIASFGNQFGVTTGVSYPRGLAIDLNNTLYVADSGNNRVLRIKNANSLTMTSSVLTSNASIPNFSPMGIGVDNSNNVYIVDAGNFNILFFHDGFLSYTVLTTPLVMTDPRSVTVSRLQTGIFSSGSALFVSTNFPGQIFGKLNPIIPVNPGDMILVAPYGTALGQVGGYPWVR